MNMQDVRNETFKLIQWWYEYIYIYSWLSYHKRSKVCMPYQVKVIQEVPYCVVGNPLEVKKGVNRRNWIC